MQQNFFFKPTAKALKTFKIFDSTLPTSWEQTGADYGNLAHFLHNIFQWYRQRQNLRFSPIFDQPKLLTLTRLRNHLSLIPQ